ncbi:MAG: leucine-rich repeat domain-containing protein [Oscillibacter sp.]|nr:leucine-rich repeat domain-containing protein [Oscillibacter sp.]
MKLPARMFLLFLTAFVLVTAARAEHSGTDIAYPVAGGNLYFDKASGTITDCEQSVTEAVIPSQIDGAAVAFIGSYAFYGCKMTGVKIPESVVSIGDSAFSDCKNLTSMEIPDGVTSIGNGAFLWCESLKSVKIPSSVTSIGYNAFSDCISLTSVEIPASVTFIGEEAFYNCARLTNINVANDNANYVSANGILFNKSKTDLICYPAGKTELSYQIPASVTSVGGCAFYGCKSLTSLEISASLTSIGNGAFWECTSLTSVKIPASVTSIERYAFYGCKSLISAEIPNSVSGIGWNAFYECDSLRDVYYGGSKEQWEKIGYISESGLISDKITIHYNASMPAAPKFQVTAAPTVNGHAIGKADLSGLTEITVPLSVSADTPAQITLCVPFYDGNGKFVGMGMATQTVSKNTTSAAVPVAGDMSGAAKLGVAILGADSRPLSAYSCPIS